VGNKTHTHFFNRTEFWMVDYEVVALEKFTARVGTVDAYKVLTTVRSGGDVLWRTTLWWSPDLKYTVSYRLVAANAADSRAWEIAAVGTGEL
jgi:hypothetical protein